MKKTHIGYLMLMGAIYFGQYSSGHAQSMTRNPIGQTGRQLGSPGAPQSHQFGSCAPSCQPAMRFCQPMQVRSFSACQPCPNPCHANSIPTQNQYKMPDLQSESPSFSPTKSDTEMRKSLQDYEQRRPANESNGRSDSVFSSPSFSDSAPADTSNQEYRHITPPVPPTDTNGFPSQQNGLDARNTRDGFSRRQSQTTWYVRPQGNVNSQKLQFLPVTRPQPAEDRNRGWIPISASASKR